MYEAGYDHGMGNYLHRFLFDECWFDDQFLNMDSDTTKQQNQSTEDQESRRKTAEKTIQTFLRPLGLNCEIRRFFYTSKKDPISTMLTFTILAFEKIRLTQKLHGLIAILGITEY